MKSGSRREFLSVAGRGVAGGMVAAGLGGCVRRGAVRVTAAALAAITTGAGSLRAHAAARGLLAGCAVNVHALESDSGYRALVREQASIVVAEREMEWAALRPAIDAYEFEWADWLIAFAEANRMRVRGHTLCGHRGLPEWFATGATPANARRLLTEHIQTVAGRYAGRMHSWDVVNEAVRVEDGRGDGLRDSPWLRLVGEDYIEVSFQAARAADPQALLTYNDYGCEEEGEAGDRKRAAVILLLRRLKARDVPIDAVGVQAHLSAGARYGDGLRRFLGEVKELGLEVLITEMDVKDREVVGDAAVAEVYGRFLDVALRDANVTAVLTGERGLPFGKDLRPVEAFFVMRRSLDRHALPGGPAARGAGISYRFNLSG